MSLFFNGGFCYLNRRFDFGRCFEDFEILHGDLQGLTDTMAFLKGLSGLDGNDLKIPEKQPREKTAAAVLFDWEVDNSVYNTYNEFS